MWPDSDTSRSFAVTRSTNTTISGEAGLSISQSPSGSVSLGLSRSTDLAVEYQLSTYSVSAHRVINGKFQILMIDLGFIVQSLIRRGDPLNREKPPSFNQTMKVPKTAALKGPLRNSRAPLDDKRLPRYQWFWAGTQDETKKLTPDLKHTVKRHVVVKRVVSLADFPLGTVEHIMPEEREVNRAWQLSDSTAWNNDTLEAPEMLSVNWRGKPRRVRPNYLLRALKRYFTFRFCINVSSPKFCEINIFSQ